MEVGEEELIGAQEIVLGGNRFLDLDDHLRAGENLGVRIDEFGPGCLVLCVGETAAGAGAPLHYDLMTVRFEFRDARRRGRDPILPVFDLFRHAYDHPSGPFVCRRPADRVDRSVRRVRHPLGEHPPPVRPHSNLTAIECPDTAVPGGQRHVGAASDAVLPCLGYRCGVHEMGSPTAAFRRTGR